VRLPGKEPVLIPVKENVIPGEKKQEMIGH
jgi:hypothetical protein